MLMQMTLGRFDYQVIRNAFQVYLQSGSAMPTPADIIKIIEPPMKKRKWCATTFIELRNKLKDGNTFVSDAEKRYCEDFLAAKIKGEEFVEETILAIENHNGGTGNGNL